MCVPSWTESSSARSDLGKIRLSPLPAEALCPTCTHSGRHILLSSQSLALKHKFAQIFAVSKENFHVSLLENFDSLLLLMEGLSNSLVSYLPLHGPSFALGFLSRPFLMPFPPLGTPFPIISHILCKIQCKHLIPTTTINLFLLCFPSQQLWPLL